MIRVLHTYRSYFPNKPRGILESIRQISLATQRNNVQNTIFTLSPEPNPRELHYPEGLVVRERSWLAPASCDLGSFAAFRAYQRLADQADVLHYHFPYPFADMLHFSRKQKTPSILTYDSDIIRQRTIGKLYAPLMWKMLLEMKFIVATSPNYAQSSPILSDPRIQPKVRIIPFGIDETSYAKETDTTILQKLQLTAGQPFFLFLGAICYYKGLDTLLKASAQVAVPIVIAGSGPELAQLKTRAEHLNLPHIIFAGQVSHAEKMTLLQHCQAFILPSDSRAESFGMVLLEAAMCSKAMITCEIQTGTSYVNQHQETGLVVTPSNAQALAEAVNTLLHNQALCHTMGKAARVRFDTVLSSQQLGKAYANLYQEALDNHA